MLRAATVASCVLLAGASAAAAPIPEACVARFERARQELIRRGFAPTSDKKTGRWLQVERDLQYPEFGLSLSLEMRTSADGPATFYWLNVNRRLPKETATADWRFHRGRYCCDEHAAPEDNLFEHRWQRATGALRAVVSVVEFREALRDGKAKRWRTMFADVARAAADDCLAAPGDDAKGTAGSR